VLSADLSMGSDGNPELAPLPVLQGQDWDSFHEQREAIFSCILTILECSVPGTL
jgi:hypothetical protein